MPEKIVTLEEKDATRLKKIKIVLDEASKMWDTAVKLLVPEYLKEFDGKKVEVLSINPDSKEMKVKVEDGGGQ